MASTRNVPFIEVLSVAFSTATGTGGKQDDDELVYTDFKLDFDSTRGSIDIINDDTNNPFPLASGLESAVKRDN